MKKVQVFVHVKKIIMSITINVFIVNLAPALWIMVQETLFVNN